MQQRQYFKQSFTPWCFTNKVDVICTNKKLWVLQYTRNSSIFVNYLKQDWHLIGKIDYKVRMFRHCSVLLLPQVHRDVQHRDRTRRGNSTLRSLWMFRFGSCILFLGIHSSSGSRTRDTTRILGLNHGWNHAFIKVLGSVRCILILMFGRRSAAVPRSLADFSENSSFHILTNRFSR